MISNLAFAYPDEETEFQYPLKQAESKPVPAAETYDLPAQLEFQLASQPFVQHDVPVPMAYTAQVKEAGRTRPRAKPKSVLHPAKVKSKFSGFSGLPGKSLQRLALLRKLGKSQGNARNKGQESQSKQPWNQDVQTVGLFDTHLTKKLPVKVLHQAKSAPRALTRPNPKDSKPQIYREWEDLKTRPELKPEENKGNPTRNRSLQLAPNLDVKFIADQEAVITQLERQLAQEQGARRAIDKQYAARMKELERLKGLDRQIEVAKKVYVERREQPESSMSQEQGRTGLEVGRKAGKEKVRPAVLSPTVAYRKPMTSSQLKTHIEVLKETVQPPPGDVIDYPVEPELGDIDEEPTRERPQTAPAKRAAPKKPESRPAVYHPVPAEQIISEVEAEVKAAKDVETRSLPPYHPPVPYPPPQSFPLSIPRGTVSSLIQRADSAEKYGARTIGLVSKVSAKYVAYYAEDLTALFVEDLLSETVLELQRIEEVVEMRTKRELRQEAGEMMQGMVQEWTDKVQKVQEKWADRPKPMPSKEAGNPPAPAIVVEDRRRRWEVSLPDRTLRSIRDYKREYDEYQQRQSGGTRLWEVYSRVGDAILSEVLDSALSAFDESLGDYTDQVISQELN